MKKTRRSCPTKKDAAPLHVTGMDEKKSIGIEFICEKQLHKHSAASIPLRIDVVDRDGEVRSSLLAIGQGL